MKKGVYMSDLHFEHVTWKRQLDFEKDDLKFLQARLEEVASDWTDQDVLTEVGQYQSKFTRHNQVIDELLHDIHTSEAELSKFAKDNPIGNDEVTFKDHTKMRDKVETQNKMYAEMKRDFARFLSKTM